MLRKFAQRISKRHLKAPETEPVRLTHHRIYILPTKYGLLLAMVLLVMLLGSMNYNNSLGYALTFLLGSMAMVSIIHTHQNLSQLIIRGGRHQAVFAGEIAYFNVCFSTETSMQRNAVCVRSRANEIQILDVPAQDTVCIKLGMPAPQRGVLRCDSFLVFTEYPLGFMYAWSWVRPDLRCVVYPRPDESTLPAEFYSVQSGPKPLRDAEPEDFTGLRDYRVGDSPRRLAWKQLAQTGKLLTKQFSGGSGSTLWLDWDALPNLPLEARLSRLCRWALECDKGGLPYGLRMPDRTIEPGTGKLHRHNVLKALALFKATGEEA